MLTEVTIQNFRSLRNVKLRLEPLTVLVGPNASGKSSILSAFDPVAPSREELWKHDPSLEASFHWTSAAGKGNGAVSWRFNSQAGFGNWVSRPYRYARIHLDVDALRNSNQLFEQTRIEPNGTGVTNLFYSLTRKQKNDLAGHFCRLVPVFQDVDTRAVDRGSHEFRFQDRWDPSVWYRPDEVSDGSMLVLAYLLISFQSPRPEFLAIEEPERGLHPYLLGELMKVLRELTAGPNSIQILLATHSAELLAFVNPEEVRFLTKSADDGSVRVEQVEKNDPNWKEAFEAHRESLGSVWLAGGLGGVPAL